MTQPPHTWRWFYFSLARSSFLSCGLGQRGKSGRLSWLRVRWVFLDGFVRLNSACVHVRQRHVKLGCEAFMYGRQKGLRETAA